MEQTGRRTVEPLSATEDEDGRNRLSGSYQSCFTVLVKRISPVTSKKS